MPIATMDLMGLPVQPFHSPLRTFSLNTLILSKTSHTAGTTLRPLSMITWSRRARVAMCSTAAHTHTHTPWGELGVGQAGGRAEVGARAEDEEEEGQ
jgi:hypothetical protein